MVAIHPAQTARHRGSARPAVPFADAGRVGAGCAKETGSQIVAEALADSRHFAAAPVRRQIVEQGMAILVDDDVWVHGIGPAAIAEVQRPVADAVRGLVLAEPMGAGNS